MSNWEMDNVELIQEQSYVYLKDLRKGPNISGTQVLANVLRNLGSMRIYLIDTSHVFYIKGIDAHITNYPLPLCVLCVFQRKPTFYERFGFTYEQDVLPFWTMSVQDLKANQEDLIALEEWIIFIRESNLYDAFEHYAILPYVSIWNNITHNSILFNNSILSDLSDVFYSKRSKLLHLIKIQFWGQQPVMQKLSQLS